MRNNQHKKIAKKTFSIIVDGETEVWYFQLLKQNEHLNIDIKPELPKKKSLSEQFNTVVENAKHYDKVFWILDFDALIKEDKDAKKGQQLKTQEFNKYLKKLNGVENVEIFVNNPCLEFWYLLHFEESGKFYSRCEDAEKAVKKYLSDYDKSEKYYKKTNNDLYTKLKPYQSKAIKNAQKLGDFDSENPQSAKAEMYKIFSFFKI